MKTMIRLDPLAVLFFVIVSPHAPAQDAVDSSRKVLIRTPPIYPTLARTMNIRGL
jgi:hypothetical protein